ncbi:MAG TPA: hypothetical protein VN721_01000 [Flavipsychrobacter sp.]|nr:hypothetical protein [Flavipsychrobacter sp.]
MINKKSILLVAIYSIAMGFLEAAVVIYLRKIYYPNGFGFPLQPVHHEIAITELWREVATIVMLIIIGNLAGRNRAERFGYFIFSFGIWDIFYYIFLKVFINWPASLVTWDILFLIPVPWVGPVVAPVIISATMILFAVTIIYFTDHNVPVKMKSIERILLLAGSLIVIVSFTQDYIERKGAILFDNVTSSRSLFTDLADYVPQNFNWAIFILGEVVILLSFVLYLLRLKNTKPLNDIRLF